MLDIKIKVNLLKPECNNQETKSEEDIIIIDTLLATLPKRGKG
jgi:hypothetical protein